MYIKVDEATNQAAILDDSGREVSPLGPRDREGKIKVDFTKMTQEGRDMWLGTYQWYEHESSHAMQGVPEPTPGEGLEIDQPIN